MTTQEAGLKDDPWRMKATMSTNIYTSVPNFAKWEELLKTFLVQLCI